MFIFKMALRFAFPLILLVGVEVLVGQAINIDSLKRELRKVEKGSEQAFQLTKALANSLRDINVDSSILVIRSALASTQVPHQKVELLNLLGRSYGRNRQLDSAIVVLEEAKFIAEQLNSEDNLINTLYNLGFAYNNLDEKHKSIKILRQSYDLANQIKDTEAQFKALNMVGNVYSYLGETDSAELFQHQAIGLLEKLGDKKRQASVWMNLGNNAARSNQIPKAMDYYNQSIALAQEIGESHMVISVNMNIAYTYISSGKFPLALEYYHKALAIAEENGFQDQMAFAAEGLGFVYTSTKDFDQAISYYEKAATIWEKVGNANQRKSIDVKKGNVYLLKKEYRLALNQYLKSFQLQEIEHKNFVEIFILFNTGKCYEQLNQLDSALYYYQLALENSLSANDIQRKLESLLGFSRVYLKQSRLDLALSSAKQAEDVSREFGQEESRMEACSVLYQIYKLRGNNSLALEYHETFRDLQDSIFSEQNIKQIAQLEAQTNFDRQKQQLEFEKEKEMQGARNRQRLILTISILLTLLLFITYRNFNLKQKANVKLNQLNEKLSRQNKIVEGQKRKLEELDNLKSRFFTNISHEFRTPLTVISGMVEQIEKAPKNWLKKGLKLIKRNNNNLLNLVNQILDLRKLESGGLQLDLIQADVVNYLRYIMESFHSLAESKEVKLHFLTDEPSLSMDFDQEKLLRIISNLLTNSIKFTPSGGDVYLIVNVNTLGVLEPPRVLLSIKIKDTGIGIPASKLPHIFNRFYQVDDSTTRKGEGTGIGLALTQELVKLMEGSIQVESLEGQGSTFTIQLPIHRDATPEVAVADPTSPSFPAVLANFRAEESQEVTGTTSSSDLPHLLIVEDNADVVQYLESFLREYYQLSVARDGQQGIDMALELIPDLILSDVMMPKKDGYSVCETLKTDERTSHIPIVLLTAKAGAESRIAGLRRGADAYLAKPFNQEELLIRLQKLLELRLQLQLRYQSMVIPSPSNDEALQQEDAFITKLRGIIEAQMEDENFGIPELCKAIGMSRSQLHLKIKALTDKSTSHYIRASRLHRAKSLLQAGDLNITQVAFEVGFKDPAYFSRTFSEEFGLSPRDFTKS